MSIQDDYYDFRAFFKEHPSMKHYSEAFERIWQWGCDCENRADKLSGHITIYKSLGYTIPHNNTT